MNVAFGKEFLRELRNYPNQDRYVILKFAKQVSEEGFQSTPGKNKYSDDIDTDDPNFLKKVDYVKKHCLWHYHIGIKKYDRSKPFGEWTSEYVLHYCRLGADAIKIVDYSAHPPFRLPTAVYLAD